MATCIFPPIYRYATELERAQADQIALQRSIIANQDRLIALLEAEQAAKQEVRTR